MEQRALAYAICDSVSPSGELYIWKLADPAAPNNDGDDGNCEDEREIYALLLQNVQYFTMLI